MLQTLEIPDPFDIFVAAKYTKVKGYIYDFFAREWSYKCSCGEELFAPTRKQMNKSRLYHTRNNCLGGY
jgi:hypothetical protein